MIQRFSVHCDNPNNLKAIGEGLARLGFARDAVRAIGEKSSDAICVHAYRDSDLDTERPMDPQRMEDYCVEIWSRIGYVRIVLTEFGEATNTVDYGEEAYFEWESA
jgi:hypothetical protein